MGKTEDEPVVPHIEAMLPLPCSTITLSACLALWSTPVFVTMYERLRGPIALSLGEKVRDPAWLEASKERLTHLMRLIDDGEIDAAERAARRYLTEYEDDRQQQREVALCEVAL